jgi:hypothetical protein
VIQDAEIWRCIADSGWIDSWPAYVVARFAAYPGNAILKAIAFPLVAQHQRATVMINEGEFVHNFDDFCISMRDFSLKWESNLASE